MIALTTKDIEQADVEVEAAREALRESERAYATHRASPSAYTNYQDALRQLDHAEARARLLRGDWQEQQAVRDLRAAVGEAAAKELSGEVKELVKSREAAVRAVVAASQSVGKALAALDAHDRLARSVGAELGKRGLRGGDDEPTGVGLDGTPRIEGKAWPFIDGAGLLGHCLAEEVAAVFPRHLLARPALGISGEARQVLAEVRGSKAGRNGR